MALTAKSVVSDKGIFEFYFSFTPFQYKLGLIKTLIDRAYKIDNTTQGFQNDINTLTTILKLTSPFKVILEMLLQKKPLNMMYPTTIFTKYLTSVSIHLIPERKFHLLSTSIARI